MASLHQKKELITTDRYLIVGKSVMFTLRQAYTRRGSSHVIAGIQTFFKGMQMNFWMFVQEVVKITIAVLFYFYFTAKQTDIAFSTPILIKDS